jgi:alkylation response protein AidB-like acyl-CoA dehydrogenase
VLGPVDGGWAVLQTALATERSIMGSSDRRRTSSRPGAPRSPDQSGVRVADRLIEVAHKVGRVDASVRDAIAKVYSMQAVNQWTGLRARAEADRRGRSPLVSLGKLAMSRLLHYGAAVQSRVVGAEALLDLESSALGSESTFLSLNAFYTSIGGGTDQIQQNILAERVLGLPREHDPSRDVAFRERVY